jgi:hypothetical protein
VHAHKHHKSIIEFWVFNLSCCDFEVEKKYEKENEKNKDKNIGPLSVVSEVPT